MTQTIDGFRIYREYIALKIHFKKDNYTYHGPVQNLKVSSYMNRNDRFYFEKIAKFSDPFGSLIACLLYDPGMWIGKIASEEGKMIHEEWLGRLQSLTYIFQKDLSLLGDDFNDALRIKDSEAEALNTLFETSFALPEYPPIIKLMLQEKISLETVSIVCVLTNCIEYWDKKLSQDPFWHDTSFKIRKYMPFIRFNKDKFRSMILDRFGSKK